MNRRSPDDETTKAIRRLMGPVEYNIARREMRGGSRRPGPHAGHRMMGLERLLDPDVKAKPAPDLTSDESVRDRKSVV